ncbi:MAG: hypothetical protein IKN72_02015 [Clostridia bacterium]|nr:hypothetical protein [Clostridia bacterium]
MQKNYPRHWLPAGAEGFVLSHVFLPDSDAALEFDLDLRFPDDDLFDQRPHDGRVIRTQDCAVFDAERNKSISERNGTVTSGLISLFLLFYGSSPYASTLFAFLCRAKKRKKYTSIFEGFRARKTKNRAQEQPIDRFEARLFFLLDFCPIFAQNAGKNHFCRGRQKWFLLWSE